MGADIHVFLERLDTTWGLLPEKPFDARHYTMFSFLAGVRNYFGIHPEAFVDRGFPEDASPEVKKEYKIWGDDAHNTSWVTREELNTFDYDKPILLKNLRLVNPNGPSEKESTWRKELGPWFFEELDKLNTIPGTLRLIFWFDS